jgi:exonuclease VII small subunit
VTTQINTIELNLELINMAYEMGLNIQKTCENGLKEAIRRLQGLIPENTSVRNAETTESFRKYLGNGNNFSPN